MQFFGGPSRPPSESQQGGDMNEKNPVDWFLERVSSPFHNKTADISATESDTSKDGFLVVQPVGADGFAMWGVPKHNSYAKLSYGRSVFRTHVVSNSDEPTWTNQFRVPFSSTEDLLVQVYHREENSEDSLLGSIVVHRSSLKRKASEGQWYDLNVPEEASASSSFVRWPRIKLSFSISAVGNNSPSPLPSNGPVEPLRPARSSATPEQPTSSSQLEVTQMTPRLRLDETPRNLFLAQIDTGKPLPSPPQQARNDRGSGNINRSNAGDQSAFFAQLRGTGSSSLPADQMDKPRLAFSSASSNTRAAIKSILLGPESPATPSAPLSQGRVKGPDSAEGGSLLGEHNEAPASGPRTVSSQNSDRGSSQNSDRGSDTSRDNSREGTAWPQFGGGFPDQTHASPRPGNVNSPSKTWTPRALMEAEDRDDRRSSAGSSSSLGSRPTSFPRVLSVKPLAKTPESEPSPSVPKLPGHWHSTWHSESNLSTLVQHSPPHTGEGSSLSPRPGSARVSPRPGSGSTTPRVLVAQAAPQLKSGVRPVAQVAPRSMTAAQPADLDLDKVSATSNRAPNLDPADRDAAGLGGPAEGTDRDGMRLALVKLAELLAKRGNMEGSAHAMRRAAMLHWQSTGHDLDIVSC